MLTAERFLETVTSVPEIADLLHRLADFDLPDCYLTAGCLYQQIWNQKSGQPPLWGVKDFDVFYFDEDTSWEAENRVIEQAAKDLGPLSDRIEIRNQARVHLWYEARFGSPIAPLTCSRDGIDGFLVACTCVGIEVHSGTLYAPYGLTELWSGILRMNAANPKPDLFAQKARDYQARWPWLSII